MDELVLPSVVRGPVDFFAFSRLALICFSVRIALLQVGGMPGHWWAGCPVIEYVEVVGAAGVGFGKLLRNQEICFLG